MTKRDLVIKKMCEIYNQQIESFSQPYVMGQLLDVAGRFIQSAEIDDPEPVTYAHRAMADPDQTSLSRILPRIHTWLRYDTTLELRKKITAEDCEKLAIRLATLL